MFTFDDAQGYIDDLFEALYTLTISETEEVREIEIERTEENEIVKETIEITVKILNVKLEVTEFDEAAQSLLSEAEYELYKILQSTQGNRPDLFT